jgi:YebC/PmpR family DNA-binding regulatory protein
MAGHSKFKNIMHRKGAQDGKRAKIFAKLAREITVASKSGMPDPQQNPRLRNAIINARHENMPNERIKKAIQKANSNEDNNDYEEIRYEGIGSNGFSLIIETLTDNRNRTASEIRSILSKNGGNLGETNSVAYNFDHVGKIGFTSEKIDKEKFFDFSVDLGALDIIEEIDIIYTICEPEIFGSLRDQLEKEYGEPSVAKLVWKIKNSLVLNEDTAKKVITIIEQLEENDDVQNVYSNIEVQ